MGGKFGGVPGETNKRRIGRQDTLLPRDPESTIQQSGAETRAPAPDRFVPPRTTGSLRFRLLVGEEQIGYTPTVTLTGLLHWPTRPSPTR
jgi:hypothetical protein